MQHSVLARSKRRSSHLLQTGVQRQAKAAMQADCLLLQPNAEAGTPPHLAAASPLDGLAKSGLVPLQCQWHSLRNRPQQTCCADRPWISGIDASLGSAASSSRTTAAWSLPLPRGRAHMLAMCRAVVPASVWAAAEAGATPSSSRTHSILPSIAAQCSGKRPSSVCVPAAAASGPSSSSCSTSAWPCKAAMCAGRKPFTVGKVAKRGSVSSRAAAQVVLPPAAAVCSGDHARSDRLMSCPTSNTWSSNQRQHNDC